MGCYCLLLLSVASIQQQNMQWQQNCGLFAIAAAVE